MFTSASTQSPASPPPATTPAAFPMPVAPGPNDGFGGMSPAVPQVSEEKVGGWTPMPTLKNPGKFDSLENAYQGTIYIYIR